MASFSHNSSESRTSTVTRHRLVPTGAVWLLICSFICSLSWGLIAWPVSADDRRDNPAAAAGGARASQAKANKSNARQTSGFVAQPSFSAAEAASRVRRLHGGRVLSVSPSRRGDSLGYRVRVLVDGGRVKTVYVESGPSNPPAAVDSRPRVRNIGDR